MRKTTVAAVLASLAAASAGARAGIEPSWSVDVGVCSKYVWRGAVLTDGPVLQPGVNLGISSVTLSVWSNMDLDDANGSGGEVNEVDYTATYDLPMPEGSKVGVTVGVVRYTFPQTAIDSTTELFVGAAFEETPGSPSITLWKDVDAVEGLYVALGAGHSFGETGLELGFSLGIGDENHNMGIYGAGSGLSDFALEVSYAVPRLPEKQSLGVGLGLTALIGDVADAVEAGGGDPSNAFLKIAYSVEF